MWNTFTLLWSCWEHANIWFLQEIQILGNTSLLKSALNRCSSSFFISCWSWGLSSVLSKTDTRIINCPYIYCFLYFCNCSVEPLQPLQATCLSQQYQDSDLCLCQFIQLIAACTQSYCYTVTRPLCTILQMALMAYIVWRTNMLLDGACFKEVPEIGLANKCVSRKYDSKGGLWHRLIPISAVMVSVVCYNFFPFPVPWPRSVMHSAVKT
jgi:hypothetical protein